MNKMIIKSAILFCIILSASSLHAQQPVSGDSIINKQVEMLVEKTDASADFTEFAEDFEILAANPVNINTRDASELARLFFLNKSQQYRILAYTTTYGDLVSVYELSGIDGMDSLAIARILPYITVAPSTEDKLNISNVFRWGTNKLLMRYQTVVEEQKGYSEATDSLLAANPDARYLGSPARLYLRYGFDYKGRVRFGVLGDKDPGEEFFGGSQKKGFDFYSAYFWAKNIGVFKRIAVGDYHLSFGQGLTMWSGLSFGKAGVGSGFSQQSRGIRPNTSTNEAMFMRGVAAASAYKNFTLTGFFSALPIDATPESKDTADGIFRTIDITGLHRTPSEIAGKGNITVTTAGGNLTYSGSIFTAGITAVSTKFSGDFAGNVSLYQLFQTQQQHELTIGADARVYLRKTEIAGEISRDVNGNLAGIVNGSFEFDPRFTLMLIYRNYNKSFKNFYSNAFGEGSTTSNEEGVYIGFRAQPGKKLQLTVYADFYRFPWLKYRVDAPSNGQEYYALAEYRLNRNVTANLRYRFEQKPLNSSLTDEKTNGIGTVNTHNLRFNIEYQPVKDVVFANRAEMAMYQMDSKNQEAGFVVFQDITWKPADFPFSVSARYALFNTDSYNTRIYAYEKDAPYSFSVPSYYDRGSRFYCLIGYEKGRWLDVNFRIGTTIYNDLQTIGSGLTEIEGNTKTEAKLQVMLKF